MDVCMHVTMYVPMSLSMYICLYVYMYVYMSVFEIVVTASHFATQNCLGCYSKLNLGIHLPHI